MPNICFNSDRQWNGAELLVGHSDCQEFFPDG